MSDLMLTYLIALNNWHQHHMRSELQCSPSALCLTHSQAIYMKLYGQEIVIEVFEFNLSGL